MAKKRTYADKAKTIMKKYEPRLGPKFDKGDTLALEAMNQELVGLRDEQEKARITKLVNEANTEQLSQFSQALQQPQGNQGPDQPGIPQGGVSGLAGGLSQGGSQPQIAGQSRFQLGGKLEDVPRRQQTTLQNMMLGRERPFMNEMLEGYNVPLATGFNPPTQQQIVYPGDVPMEQAAQQGNFIPFGQDARAARKFTRQAPRVSSRIGRTRFPGSEEPIRYATGGHLPMYQGGGAFDDSFVEEDIGIEPWMTQSFGSINDQLQAENLDRLQEIGNQPLTPQTNAGDDIIPFKSRVPYLGAVSQGLGALLANRQIDIPGVEGVEDIQAQQLTPRLVDYSRGREQIMRERDRSQAMIRGAARGRGTQQGLTQTTIAGATEAQRIAGQGVSGSIEAQANRNAQIRNEVAARQQQSDLQAALANQRKGLMGAQFGREDALINAQRRSQQIGGVFGAATQYGKDLMSADQYDQMMQIMAPENYQFGQGEDSRLRKILQVSPTMKRFFADLGQRTATS